MVNDQLSIIKEHLIPEHPMNRDDFLAAIRTALQHTALPGAQAEPPPAPALPNFSAEQLIAPFGRQLTALQGRIHHPEAEAAALQTILDIFAAHHAAEYLAWDEAHLPLKALIPKLAAHGLARRSGDIPRDPEARRQTLAGLSPVTVGLTGALAGLADTGSLVLQSGPGRGRLASLLPPVHIALLQTERLFPTLGHFVQAHPNALRQASNLVLVTGPSRTGDIEQILTLGVHGPKELHVILC